MSASLIWFIAGIILMILEFVIPGLIVIFFGVGAWFTALLLLLFPFTIEVQLVLFLIGSVASLIFLRKYLVRRRKSSLDEDAVSDALIGEVGEVTKTISPKRAGSIFLRGTSWKAEAECRIESGEKAVVTGKNGLVVTVEKLEK